MFEQVTELPMMEMREEVQTPAPEAPPQLSGVTLKKLFRREEYDFLCRCRNMISQLTGETFDTAAPPWLHFANMGLECDAYCERLKISLSFAGAQFYDLPAGLHHLYDDRADYSMMLEYIDQSRMICNWRAGVLDIQVPYMMSDRALREFLRAQLHGLTRYRVWVGSPRCIITNSGDGGITDNTHTAQSCGPCARSCEELQ
jgi:hypothetical protein